MKKKNIIQKSTDFDTTINMNNKFINKYFSIFVNKNSLKKNRYGISVPKKLGIAVLRNKKKRQVKTIIDVNENMIPKFYDYVIILKKEILELSYEEMANNLITLLKKNKGDKNEK